jgi:hypothetical protein
MMFLRSSQTPQSVPALWIDFAFGEGRLCVVTFHLGLPVSLKGCQKLLIVGTCHHFVPSRRACSILQILPPAVGVLSPHESSFLLSREPSSDTLRELWLKF